MENRLGIRDRLNDSVHEKLERELSWFKTFPRIKDDVLLESNRWNFKNKKEKEYIKNQTYRVKIKLLFIFKINK